MPRREVVALLKLGEIIPFVLNKLQKYLILSDSQFILPVYEPIVHYLTILLS